MGLDMYLTKKTYLTPDKNNFMGVANKEQLSAIKFERVSEIVEDVGYWRKANAIHQWFVDNVQDGEDDCGSYEVSKEAMLQLLSLVNAVIANHDMAKTLLPTQEGFFFGGTEYDEYYCEDLELTRDILTQCIQEFEQNPRSYFMYHSSW